MDIMSAATPRSTAKTANANATRTSGSGELFPASMLEMDKRIDDNPSSNLYPNSETTALVAFKARRLLTASRSRFSDRSVSRLSFATRFCAAKSAGSTSVIPGLYCRVWPIRFSYLQGILNKSHLRVNRWP